jgi:tripartite-type tricarboxylate transporter receptor subunit TctC
MKSIKLIYRSLAVISIALGSNFVNAQAYPDRPITLVVPNPPGGLVDTSARLLSEPLTRVIGQPVIVDNKPGASGNVAYQYVAKAKPDGYTLLASSIGPISINPTLFGNLPVNPQKALQPVSLLGDVPNILVVPATSNIKTWKEFTAYLKANPNAINYGSTGIGTTAHLISYLFAQKLSVEALHIPYKGAEATRDLVAGRLQFMFATAPSVVPLIKAGQLNAIAVYRK